MSRTVRFLALAATLVWCSASWAAETAFDDAWLGPAAIAELRKAQTADQYTALQAQLESAAIARLAIGNVEKLASLNDVIYAWRGCQYLPAAQKTGEAKFVTWLLDNRELSRRLFRAISEGAAISASMDSMHELYTADAKLVLTYPDLAVAFATSRVERHYRKLPEPCTMLEAFAWFANPQNKFHYDLKTMPYELSRFLADSRLSKAERQWAAKTYAGTDVPAKCYFDLKYDYDAYTKGVPMKNAAVQYTIQNLKQVGGVCIDQAYFAAEVCKSVGVPATIVTGRGGSGIGHAWLACLRVKNKEAYWDTQTGRYESQQYFIGLVNDPATGRELLDAELMLACMAAQLPLDRREEADTATMLALLVEKNASSAEVSFDALKKFADAHNAATADANKIDTSAFRATRKLDISLTEDLLALAIERNLAHRAAWETIVALRTEDRLPVDHLDRFFDLLVNKTSKQFPDYSCLFVGRAVATIPDPARREKAYRKAIEVYGSRPDLQGRLLIAMGDDYEKQGDKEKALKAYDEAATKCATLADIVVSAASKAETLLVDAGKRDLAIGMYQRLFAKTRKSEAADMFATSTSFFQLGRRLAILLEDAGQTAAAKAIRQKIGDKGNF